ncbi:MAG: hypothetical protein ACOYN4_15035 [Bacteroidales bacterium]
MNNKFWGWEFEISQNPAFKTEHLKPIFATLFKWLMYYLILSLFFSTCIFISFKYFPRFGINILPAITINYLTATILGYFSRIEVFSIFALVQAPWFFMAILTGMAFILTFFTFALSTQRVGVAMTVVSGKMSIILSATVGFLLLAEPYTFTKIEGIMVAIIAFYFTNKRKEDIQIEKKYLFLPLLIFIGTGANDSLMKLSGVYFPNRDEIQFLTATFFAAFVIGFVILVYKYYDKTLNIKYKDVVSGILLGILNWFSTLFFIKGLFVLPISFFVPVFNAALVFIAAVSGYFFFGEKLSVLNRVGIALALIAIAVIALS